MSERRDTKDRRGWGDRRRRRTRRIVENDQALVVEISDSTLSAVHLQRFEGETPDRVSATTVRWRHDAPSLLTEEGRAELAAAMTKLAKLHAGFTGGLHIVLSGDSCVTRAIRGTTDEVRRELQQLEQRSRLYLSLGPGEKVLVKSVRSLDARHQYALVAVCNQATLDALQNAAEAAGLQIESIEPCLSAACRAASRVVNLPGEPCVLIHVDHGSPEIGIFQQGELLLDYRPGGQTRAENLPELLEEHLSRLQRHAARQLGSAAPKLSRVYLCGDETLVARAMQGFQSNDKFAVEKISPSAIQATWQLEKDAELAATAPALGGLLGTYLPTADRDSPNLMEHIIASTREPLRPTIVRGAAPLAAILLAAAGMWVLNGQQQKKVDALETEIAALAPARAKSNELRLKMLGADAKFNQLDVLAKKLDTPIGSRVVKGLSNCMPSDVWLSGVEVRNGASIRLAGSSFADAGVFDFVRWLEQAPQFADVALKSTKPGVSEVGNITNFSLELGVKKSDDQARKVARRE